MNLLFVFIAVITRNNLSATSFDLPCCNVGAACIRRSHRIFQGCQILQRTRSSETHSLLNYYESSQGGDSNEGIGDAVVISTEVKTTRQQRKVTKQRRMNVCGESNGTVYVEFSLCFHRYVVFYLDINNTNCTTNTARSESSLDTSGRRRVIGSFKFLDEALQETKKTNSLSKNNIMIVTSPITKGYLESISSLNTWSDHTCGKSGNGNLTVQEDSIRLCVRHNQTNNSDIRYQEILNQLAALVQPIDPVTKMAYFTLNVTRNQLGQMIPRERFFQLSTSVKRNYNAIIDLFTRYYRNNITAPTGERFPGLCFSPVEAQGVISTFPHIALYDINEIRNRINFLTSPLPHELIPFIQQQNCKTPKISKEDWPLLSSQGFGAGFTVQQATECIRAVPELLALFYEDSMKPSVPYFFNNWKIKPEDAEDARCSVISSSLVGCSASDAYCFAYLHKTVGIPWISISIMIQALPSTLVCDTTIPWEIIMDNTAVKMGGELKFPSLNFLRQRLQVSPKDVHYMITTHSRLGLYEVETNIKPTLDDIQLHLGLSCMELRNLALGMPSLIGMKTSGSDCTFFRRLSFYQNDVGMSLEQIRSAVTKQPSLFQYSVEDNLRPKLSFFTQELKIEKIRLAKMIQNSPALFGLSLQRNLRPKVEAIMDYCCLTAEQVGEIVSTSPSILSLSITRKILPTLQFIETALDCTCTDAELGSIILKAPRLLLHSVETSLSRKINLLEEALLREKTIIFAAEPNSAMNIGDDIRASAAMVLKRNPALLLQSCEILKNRLSRILERSEKSSTTSSSLEISLLPSRKGRDSSIKLRDIQVPLDSGETNKHLSQKINRTNCNSSKKAINATHNIDFTSRSKGSDDTMAVTLLVLGRVYSEEPNSVRGVRKSEGISISILEQTVTDHLADLLRSAANACFGSIIPDGLTDFDMGVICVGSSILKPSRRRCDLYACHAGLKICSHILKNQSDGANKTVIFRIFTDSQYSFDLLKNSRELDKWASKKSLLDFTMSFKKEDNNVQPLHFVNSDLLFPLCQTYKRLVEGKYAAVSVEFLHISDIGSPFLSNPYYQEFLSNATRSAKDAAFWQFNRAKQANVLKR